MAVLNGYPYRFVKVNGIGNMKSVGYLKPPLSPSCTMVPKKEGVALHAPSMVKIVFSSGPHYAGIFFSVNKDHVVPFATNYPESDLQLSCSLRSVPCLPHPAPRNFRALHIGYR